MDNTSITIAKIKLSDEPHFYKKYICKVVPVVITDLYQGQAIRDIRCKQDVIHNWGDIAIPVQDEYVQAYEQAATIPGPEEEQAPAPAVAETHRTMTIRDYYEFCASHSGVKKMCIEFTTPAQIKSCYSIPDICQHQPRESKTRIQQCFVGNKGNVANIHFDKGGHNGFLYQIFGKKRFVVFPHSAAKKLLPFTQMSGWKLQHFSDRERRDFLHFTGGQEVVLDAGDAIFVPAFCWHFADYLEDSMAIRIRFRRPGHSTELLNYLFPDMFTQGIIHKLADPALATTLYPSIISRILQCSSRRYLNGKQRVMALRLLAKEIYYELYPEEPMHSYSLDLENYLPPLLPHFLDADHRARPYYE